MPRTAPALLWAAAVLLCLGHLSADVGLRFVRAPEPIAAPPGDDVVFECSLNVPAEQVRWRHNGRYLSHPHSSSHLVVRVVDAAQAGDYQCVAWYGASALASVPARLSLAELAAAPAAQPDLVLEPHLGNTITIHCPTPHSNPPAVLQYYKDGVLVPDSARVIPSTDSLVLANVSVRDEGVYTCSATNYITAQTVPSQQKAAVRVLQDTQPRQPRFLYRPPENYTVQSGSNVTMECAAVGYPAPGVSWRKLSGSLPVRAKQVPGGLQLVNVVPSDRGAYVCEANNGVGRPLAHVITLHPQEPPTLLSEPPRTSVVEEGGSCQLECSFHGEPAPVISWILNGESVSNDSLIVANGGTLHITRLEKRHAGIYQCVAWNSLGATYGSSMLQVKPQQVTAQLPDDLELEGHSSPLPFPGHSQPGKKEHRHGGKGRGKDKKHKGNAVMIPPTKPHITRLSDESVMVRWQVPPNDGLPIQFFKVQYRELGNGRSRGGGRGRVNRWMTSNEDIPPHIRSYEVANLEPDHTYRFRIAAVYSNNDNKLGPNSARFHLHRGSPTLKTHLNAPSLIRAEAVSPSAIQIHWQYTPSAATPIEGFYVYYRATSSAGDYVKATVEGEQTRAYVITHLLPDTPYDIKLQSFTVGAASDFSAIRTHKTSRETTTPPPQVIAAGPSVVTDTGSSHGQLYMVLGAVLGGLGLLLGLFLLLFLCNRHNQPSQDDLHINHETMERDKPLEPVVNGYTLNGHGGSNHSNGRLQPNGLLVHANTITITGNPLDVAGHDKKHTTMEMTFLSSHTNNNSCSVAQRAAAAAAASSGGGTRGGGARGGGTLLTVRSSLRASASATATASAATASAAAGTAEEDLMARQPRPSENYV